MNRLVRLWWQLAVLLGLHSSSKTEVVEDFPDVLETDRVYLVGDGFTPWSAAFLCPCGCGEVIKLSLIKNDRPRWRVRLHFNGTVTFHPSIWRNKGCKSHFFLRCGRVFWVRNNTALYHNSSK